jgi:O-acetyl-ADP-ribose deacetylase (regulator of RNase III)
MIELAHGNLLASQAEALVNTVNTVGVMGKGVALQFKQAFPANYRAYRAACERDEMKLGHMFVWDSARIGPRRFIVNFPTKQHWRAKSQLSDIRAGLADLVRVIDELGITSIALPALGCGNGGLDWLDVRSLIETALGPLDVQVFVFPPAGPPDARDMPVGTDPPAMTDGRAALLVLLAGYAQAAMRERFDLIRPGASLLEIQKLGYLLQTSGLPLRLSYAKGKYGPYAENLNFVLQRMEGHCIRGYGDRTQAVLRLDPIETLPRAVQLARKQLTDKPAVLSHVDRVRELTDGWESAYGTELLATTHYAARSGGAAPDVDRAVTLVHTWNTRKQTTFPRSHIERAWRRLDRYGWLASHHPEGGD